MKKAKYRIVDSQERYFVKISEQNKIIFTKNADEAAKMDYSETEDIIPLIEQYSGHVATAEPV